MPADPAPDDPAIDDEEIIYRRVHSRQVKWGSDGTVERVGSNAFEDSFDGSYCSIALASMLVANGLDPLSLLDGYEHMGLISFTARDARDCGFGVLPTPKLPDEPAHGDLTGDKGPQSPRRRLAKRAAVIRPPVYQR
jgi:hypothetical protein